MDHYQRIKARLNKLLAENPADEVLNGIIPDSKFVKIYYGEDRYYSLGLVKENDIPQYMLRRAVILQRKPSRGI